MNEEYCEKHVVEFQQRKETALHKATLKDVQV
jgi:hypothetical protein